jgi:hypothetical protein
MNAGLETFLKYKAVKKSIQWIDYRPNGYCESFTSKLRNELPDGKIFYTLKEAKIMIETWRSHYNTI